MIIPPTKAHLAGPLAAFAARLAATTYLPDDQLRWRPERATVPSRPIARQLRPAPRSSRQYARELSTQVARDRRLSPRCAALAAVLVAQAGKGTLATISRRYLGMVLQVSTRTVARLLAELRAYGYIATTHRLGSLGQTIGLRVELLDPLLPFWETEVVPAVSPPITSTILNSERKRLQDVDKPHFHIGDLAKPAPLQQACARKRTRTQDLISTRVV